MHRHCSLRQLAFLLLTVSAGAQESPQLRLVDWNHPCIGVVEILHQQSKAIFCANSWDVRVVHVVCRQLGCGVVIRYRLYDRADAGAESIQLGELDCTGREDRLWQCPSWSWGQHNCSRPVGVGVRCSGFVRLGGHYGLCSGRVEVNPGGDWTLVSDMNFTFPTAQVICADLGCGKAVSVLLNASRKASEQVWAEGFQCAGQEPELWSCPRVPCPGGSCRHGGAVEVVCEENVLLRLVEGNNRCMGRVEILQHGSWGTICDESWDKRDGQVVCRQLGCGEALDALLAAPFGPGSGLIVLSHLNCTGEESRVQMCPSLSSNKASCFHQQDAGVICSGFVRLAGGQGPCSGRVEVNPGGGWTPVLGVNFTLPTAQVICAELGCGKAASVLRDVRFRADTEQVLDEEFRCAGQEPQLWFCPRAPCPGGSCGHGGAVEVVCSEYTEVRLMKNGTSQCEGRVEMSTSAGWRPLCASHWSMANAHVVCRQLACGVALSTPKGAYSVEGGDEIWKGRFHCSGAESFLWSCPVTSLGVPACAAGNTASVVCSGNQTRPPPPGSDSLSEPAGPTASGVQAAHHPDSTQLRLADGGGRCAGRVEVLHRGSWGTICDDGWDLRDAQVVCRQLGCGAALGATVSARSGEGSGPVWLDELSCTGEEPHVWTCPSRGWGQHDCRHKEDAGVVCSEFVALRLVSEDQECAGWLEVFYNGTWGSVCHSPMEATTLSVICRQLGCGDSGALNSSVPARAGSRPRWVDGIECRKSDASLWQCLSDPWNPRSCSLKEEAYITCAGQRPKSCPDSAPCTDREKLRLRGGDSECSGRVELWHEGSWGTVCDDSWGLAEAEVVCQQLGCGPALDALGEAAFGPGNGSIWLDEVRCRGRESSLWACARAPWGQSDCKHEEDAGVRCSGERTTVPPPSRSRSSVSAPVPEIFSLPVILCIILGALLFLVLIIMGILLHRRRAELQASSALEDAQEAAVYQEIDYLIKPEEEELLDSAGNLYDDSVTKLPYYTGDKQEEGEWDTAPDATGDGYDDVEDLPAPEIPSSSGMSEKNTFPEEEDGVHCSQEDISLHSPRAAANSSTEEKGHSQVLGQEEAGYDDIELNTM